MKSLILSTDMDEDSEEEPREESDDDNHTEEDMDEDYEGFALLQEDRIALYSYPKQLDPTRQPIDLRRALKQEIINKHEGCKVDTDLVL